MKNGQKMQRVYVSLPKIPWYKHIIVLTHPGVIYVNLCADEDAIDVIFRELVA